MNFEVVTACAGIIASILGAILATYAFRRKEKQRKGKTLVRDGSSSDERLVEELIAMINGKIACSSKNLREIAERLTIVQEELLTLRDQQFANEATGREVDKYH